MAAWIKMPLGMEVGLSPGDFVLDENPAAPPQKKAEPQILAHVYCGQTAGWIKMALGTEVGLSPGDFVLGGNPAIQPPKGGQASFQIFGRFLLWPNGWMYQDATWYGGRPHPMGLCVRWGPIALPKRGRSPQIFGPCLLWPNGWMDQEGTWHGSRPQPRRLC